VRVDLGIEGNASNTLQSVATGVKFNTLQSVATGVKFISSLQVILEGKEVYYLWEAKRIE
jgi:hypothetical protein